MDVSKDVSKHCAKDVSIDVSSWLVPTLEAAPGIIELLDSEYGYALDSSNKVSLWLGRKGNLLVQPSGPLQPLYGALSPAGRRGITFAAASSQYLIQSSSPIAAALANASYSMLAVLQPNATGASRTFWACGDVDTQGTIAHQVTATGKEAYRRTTSAGGATNNTSTTDVGPAPSIVSATYDATADLYNSWVNGGAAQVNQSQTRDATGVDALLAGASMTLGAITNPTNATVWGLLIALGVWTTADRLRLEQAARIYFLGASS